MKPHVIVILIELILVASVVGAMVLFGTTL